METKVSLWYLTVFLSSSLFCLEFQSVISSKKARNVILVKSIFLHLFQSYLFHWLLTNYISRKYQVELIIYVKIPDKLYVSFAKQTCTRHRFRGKVFLSIFVINTDFHFISALKQLQKAIIYTLCRFSSKKFLIDGKIEAASRIG